MKADSRQEELRIVEDYSRAVQKNRRKLNSIDGWCQNNLGVSFADVIRAEPNLLLNLRDQLRVLKAQGIKLSTSDADYLKDNLYKTLGRSHKGSMSAKEILLSNLDVTVCPYCNRNFIYTIGNRHKKDFVATCELDHFLPKSQYPLLAVSFYNLIPSCHFCNHTKGEHDLKAFYPYMITPKETGQIRFTYWPKGTDYCTNKDSLDVDIIISPKRIKAPANWQAWSADNIRKDIDKLNLPQLYSKHNDVAQKILLKYLVTDENYIDDIYMNFRQYFISRDEVRNLMLDSPGVLFKAADEPLGKLKMDILAECGATMM